MYGLIAFIVAVGLMGCWHVGLR